MIRTAIERLPSFHESGLLLPALRRASGLKVREQTFQARFDRMRERVFSVGLFVPTSGALGMWGPSAIACARLAAEEINRGGGLLDQEVRLRLIDSADEQAGFPDAAAQALEEGEIDAIVGMHTSAVRQRLLQRIGAPVPYVYTPLYEGGEHTPGVYAIGETPQQQLRPAIHALTGLLKLRRWVLLGNDYVWPHVSHALARGYIREVGGEVADDIYLPLGTREFEPVMTRLAAMRADGLLLSLVGQDAVEFNRQFGASARLMRRMVRLSCAIEENGLLAIGAGNTEGLYAAAGYFSGLQSDASMAFRERYYGLYGDRAPTLNALGQSTYEGLHFLGELMERRRVHRRRSSLDPGPFAYRSAREATYLDNDNAFTPMYLARAEGHLFQVVRRL
jgi:ABC-type branched-subunit amino acid transport system substrate-binding protein